MNNFRKFITTPYGNAIYYTIGAFLFAFFGLRSSLLFASVYCLFAGYIAGYRPAKKLIDDNDYFVRNIQQNRYAVTKRFKKLLRQELLPEDKAEHADFVEFLDATEQKHTKNPNNKIALPLICIGFFAFMVTADARLTPLSACFLLITGIVTFLYIRDRTIPQKITTLREKITITPVQS